MSLINAIERQDVDSVRAILAQGADVNAAVGEAKNTPLHLAAKNKNEEVVALLINAKANVNMVNKWGRTALHEAARVGSLPITRQLLEQCAGTNNLDHERWAPLHNAAQAGSVDVVNYLLDHGAEMNILTLDENSPLHLAAMAGHEAVCELLIDRGADPVRFNSEGKSAVKIMTEQQAFDMKFFFRIISLQNEAEILAQMSSPIRFVNQIVKEPKQGLSCLGNEVYRMLRSQNRHVLRYLLVWYSSLVKAAKVHGHEKVDLLAIAECIEEAVSEIFACDSMDDPVNVQRVLQPDKPALTLGKKVVDPKEIYRCQLTAFESGGVLDLCLRHGNKFVFGRQQVSGFISKVFAAPARFILRAVPSRPINPGEDDDEIKSEKGGRRDQFSSQIPFVARIEDYFHFNIFDPDRFGLSYSLRSCPKAMFGMELVSKSITLFLIAFVAVGDYGRKYGLDYSPDDYDSTHSLSAAETALVFFLFSNLCYEIGQLAEGGWSLSVYFEDDWNKIDSLCMVMLITWFIARVSCDQLVVARIVLALVAIPMSAGSLRYLTVSKTLGVIVATTSAMFYDLVAFLAVYGVTVLGFGIFFLALFYGNSSFSNIAQTISQMFQFTLSNFDFDAFDSNSREVNALAQVVLAIYLTLTAVLLLNLLIARMSNAYQRVDDKAVQEWSFAKTQTVLQYLLLKERHVFCMLPSPFNLITTACYPIHYLFLNRTGISLGGTVGNWVLAFVGGPIRVYALFYCFRTGMKALLRRAFNYNKNSPFLLVSSTVFIVFLCCLSAIYLTVHVVVFYPFFAWSDLVERVDSSGTLSYISSLSNRSFGQFDADDRSVVSQGSAAVK